MLVLLAKYLKTSGRVFLPSIPLHLNRIFVTSQASSNSNSLRGSVPIPWDSRSNSNKLPFCRSWSLPLTRCFVPSVDNFLNVAQRNVDAHCHCSDRLLSRTHTSLTTVKMFLRNETLALFLVIFAFYTLGKISRRRWPHSQSALYFKRHNIFLTI